MRAWFAALLLMIMAGAGCQAEEVTLKTAYENVEPKFIKYSPGNFGGLCVELMSLISKDTGIRFRAKDGFVPKKRYLRDLEQGEVDVLFGLKKDVEREKWLVFGEPLYEVKYIALLNEVDSLEVRNAEDIRGLGKEGVVLTIFGAASADCLRGLGLTVDDGAKDVEAGIGKLLAKRGRLFVYQNLSTMYELRKSKFKHTVRVVDLDMRKYEHYVVFSKMVDPELVRRINRSIVKLKKNGDWDKVTRKYLNQ